jgi:hypothetical protein
MSILSRPPSVSPSPTGVFSGPPYAKLPHSYKGLRRAIFIAIIIVALASVGYYLYQTYLSPAARAYSISNTYMTAMTSDNPDWAAYLSSTDTAPSSLESAATAVKGSYTLVLHTEQSGAYYALYKLSSPANQFARTIVIQTPKGFRVSSFLYSGSELALIPGGALASANAPAKTRAAAAVAMSGGTSSGEAAAESASSASATPTKVGTHTVVHGVTSGTVAACLAQSDYTSVFADAGPGSGATWSAGSPYTAEVDFNPGSTGYTDDVEIGDLLTNWGRFSQQYPSKNYTIHLQASATSGSSLADSRIAKIRANLIADGASAAAVVVDSAQSVSTTDTDPAADLSPFVILSVIPGSGC